MLFRVTIRAPLQIESDKSIRALIIFEKFVSCQKAKTIEEMSSVESKIKQQTTSFKASTNQHCFCSGFLARCLREIHVDPFQEDINPLNPGFGFYRVIQFGRTWITLDYPDASFSGLPWITLDYPDASFSGLPWITPMRLF